MTDEQRDELLLDLRDRLVRIEGDHGARLRRIEAKVDAVDARVSDVARAVRELGGDVDDPPAEATG